MTASVALESSARVGGAGYAATRVVRLLTMSLGISNLVLLSANLPGAIAQASVLTWPLTLFVVAIVVGCTIVALACFSWAPLGAIRWLWRGQALGMLIAYAAVPVVLDGTKLPTSMGLTWLSELEILAGCAAAVAWTARWAVVYTAVLQLITLTTAAFWAEGALAGRAFGDATRQLFFVSLFTCLALALVRAGGLLDATVDSAVAEARTAAAADQRRIARRRIELLVHDSVIVALLAYISGAGAERSAAQAEDALEAIRFAGHQAPTPRARTPRDLAWELQGLTTELDPDADFEYTVDGDDAVPEQVAAALCEATSEAIRNSIRHAPTDRTVLRQLHVLITANHAAVVILDDGEGFELAAVSHTRVGIRQGIIGRMRGVPGGSAEVSSRPGFGTAVSLRWTRP